MKGAIYIKNETVDIDNDNVSSDNKPNVEVKTYTESEIEDLIKPFKDEVERLRSNDESASKAEINLQNRSKELWSKEVAIELKLQGLSDFAEFFAVDENNREELEAKIKKFNEVLGKRELNDGFVPESHRSADKYSLAEKSKDTKGMINSKLSKLFKQIY
ncbi:hypothetical protein GCM10008018_66240 [Paenibacillus marchantiophytorum]|uniref:DUF4355 domain-containing protein n=1 Tax=Paenibacillus marchantiophytorum TaxID=1619310 RepID=A0ABQ1FGP7_9BACL|nr:hypothetical protein [Paenibacillus marchantiophytorum]GGA11915.1 hypothetical protein GCM10008018_66240 [Paenibacillus marchantiophytorum]